MLQYAAKSLVIIIWQRNLFRICVSDSPPSCFVTNSAAKSSLQPDGKLLRPERPKLLSYGLLWYTRYGEFFSHFYKLPILQPHFISILFMKQLSFILSWKHLKMWWSVISERLFRIPTKQNLKITCESLSILIPLVHLITVQTGRSFCSSFFQ